jgi:amphi-Trp domain-containing protein
MEPKLELEIEERLPANAVALYLELMAAGLRKGRARVSSGDLLVEFSLPSDLGFELAVKVDPEKRRGKVEIEFSWRTERDAAAGPELRISPGS